MSAEIDFRKLKFVVLDEADRLLSTEGFIKDVEKIITCIPSKVKQTLLFSATMTISNEHMKILSLREPEYCSVGPKLNTVDTLQQEYIFIPAAIKESYLTYLLRSNQPDEEFEQTTEESNKQKSNMISIIVFVSNCSRAQLLFEMLRELNIRVVSLHSAIPQYQRIKSLDSFRSGYAKVLIATDVASRGLDIPTVELVINYDIPRETEDYIHRVGRTARADRYGKAVTFVTQYDITKLHTIENTLGKKLEECQVNEKLVLRHLNETTLAKAKATLKLDDSGFTEKIKTKRKNNFNKSDNKPNKHGKI